MWRGRLHSIIGSAWQYEAGSDWKTSSATCRVSYNLDDLAANDQWLDTSSIRVHGDQPVAIGGLFNEAYFCGFGDGLCHQIMPSLVWRHRSLKRTNQGRCGTSGTVATSKTSLQQIAAGRGLPVDHFTGHKYPWQLFEHQLII